MANLETRAEEFVAKLDKSGLHAASAADAPVLRAMVAELIRDTLADAAKLAEEKYLIYGSDGFAALAADIRALGE